ncbi:MAG: RcnB family protein [Novosphingobium sp.]
MRSPSSEQARREPGPPARSWSGARQPIANQRESRRDQRGNVRAPAVRTAQPATVGRSGHDDRNHAWRNPDRRTARDRDQHRDRNRDDRTRSPRDRDHWEQNRDRNYRDHDSDYRRNHNRSWNRDYAYRHDYRNRNRHTWRNDYRNWNRHAWRNDHRYDWRSYRARHHSTYRTGRYYAPYYGYSYRRFGIGIRLGSLFYGSRYWINDPWQYRLPAVYGPYRWVRYYDDVLLVNVYTGEVVDAIYDFFW